MAFPVEEGLKPQTTGTYNAPLQVFMAFPVEEGLKHTTK